MKKEERKVYLTILNFMNGRIHQYKLTQEIVDDSDLCEEFMMEEGFSLGNIEWMTHDIKEIVDNTILSTIKKDN